MFKRNRLAVCAGVLALGALGLADPAHADDGVKAGVLTCNVDSGWGFVFGSSRGLKCTYAAGAKASERYSGNITKFGVDIGYTQGGVIVWVVVAPTTSLAPGALAGDYAGVSGSASIGVGVGANVLLGGFKNSISLQPLSVEGMQGLNVAGGIAAVSLRHEP
jgi:hypothetical protein